MWTTIIGVALVPVALIIRVTLNDIVRTIWDEIRGR